MVSRELSSSLSSILPGATEKENGGGGGRGSCNVLQYQVETVALLPPLGDLGGAAEPNHKAPATAGLGGGAATGGNT